LSFWYGFDASLRRIFEASDVRNNVLSFWASDTCSDVKSAEMSEGRSNEARLRASVLRCFPVEAETSGLTSFPDCVEKDEKCPVQSDERGMGGRVKTSCWSVAEQERRAEGRGVGARRPVQDELEAGDQDEP